MRKEGPVYEGQGTVVRAWDDGDSSSDSGSLAHAGSEPGDVILAV
jgi:hypothetical protein